MCATVAPCVVPALPSKIAAQHVATAVKANAPSHLPFSLDVLVRWTSGGSCAVEVEHLGNHPAVTIAPQVSQVTVDCEDAAAEWVMVVGQWQMSPAVATSVCLWMAHYGSALLVTAVV